MFSVLVVKHVNAKQLNIQKNLRCYFIALLYFFHICTN
jgi:hypothetical protein